MEKKLYSNSNREKERKKERKNEREKSDKWETQVERRPRAILHNRGGEREGGREREREKVMTSMGCSGEMLGPDACTLRRSEGEKATRVEGF